MELKNTARRAEDIPDTDHYALIMNGTDAITGLVYQAFSERRTWEKAIEKAQNQGRVFRAMHVNAARVSTRIDITVMDRPISTGGED